MGHPSGTPGAPGGKTFPPVNHGSGKGKRRQRKRNKRS